MNLEIIADFLNLPPITYSFFFFNLWSIIHFASGGLVFFLVNKFKIKTDLKFFIFFLLLGAYELFELFIISLGIPMFRTELIIDIVYDLIYGFLGGLVVYYLIKK